MPFKIFVLAAGSLLCSPVAWGQGAAPALTPVPLQDLSAFRPTSANWRLAGDVFYDARQAGKNKITPGTGVLVDVLGKSGNGHLLTQMEHGDLELELEFMMAKNSNSGVYLQGRYEVQLFDSWGVTTPKSSDAGAIYERWDESRPEGRKGYEGHPPAQNVSKAPGLWQQLRIVFRAPRFNAQGIKTENARFVKVIHNGVTIHENVEVTGPTRAAAFTDEKPLGPLMIQGDHGAVAIRNIRYQAYGTGNVTLKNLKLTSYEGKFRSLNDFNTVPPKSEMDVDVLAHLAPSSRDEFAGKITGTLHVPTPGTYHFNLNLTWIPMDTNPGWVNGMGELTIGGKKVLTVTGRTGVAKGSLDLPAGDHPFELQYYKSSGYWYARGNDIALSVSGPGVAYTALNAPFRAADPVGAITVQPRNGPVMQRGFMEHQGKKRTHVIAVGEPSGVNYAVDLQTGSFLQAWRGGFLETTPMWYGRGETQLAVPMGSVLAMTGKPSLTPLANQQAAWPDSNATFTFLGYDLTPAGRPVFKYALGNTQIREFFEPGEDGRQLTHAFTVRSGAGSQAIWCRVAAGSVITKLPNGLYAVNDKQYLIQLDGKVKPVIRQTAQNTTEMLLPVRVKDGVGSVKYSIVW